MILRGRGISPGFARGVSHVVDARTLLDEALGVDPRGTPLAERERLLAAIGRACVQLDRVKRQLDRRVARNDLEIFDTHASILRDSKFVGEIEREIVENHQSAEAAVARIVGQAHATFAANPVPLVHDKAADLLDIGRRLLECLSFSGEEEENPSDTIVVASAVTPSELVRFCHYGVAAIVVESCGAKSHTAILARGMGIPFVAGIASATETIPKHAEMYVDAAAGLVIVSPTSSEQGAAETIRRQVGERPAGKPAQVTPPITADGQRITLLLNISDVAEAEAARNLGADGVGLFRTEFLYMDHAWWPTEDESYADYRKVAEALDQGELSIRLADFGAEKSPPYADMPSQRNPSLGLRGIRLLLQREDILRPQLKAIARLAEERPITLLLPMLDSLDTLHATLRVMCQVLGCPRREKLPFQVGAMIELPSAAMMVEEIAASVDGLSIGLNDLTQYLLAADRDDELVEAYHDAMQPAVLRLVDRIVSAGSANSKPVTICGELAGDPSLTGLLLALGVRRLSVSRFSYQKVSEAVGRLNLASLLEHRAKLLALTTAAEVKRYVNGVMSSATVGPSDWPT